MTTKAQSVAKLIQERDELAEQLLLLEKLVEQLTSYCYPPNGEGGVRWRKNLPMNELMNHVHKLFRYRVMQGDIPGMAPTPGENLL